MCDNRDNKIGGLIRVKSSARLLRSLLSAPEPTRRASSSKPEFCFERGQEAFPRGKYRSKLTTTAAFASYLYSFYIFAHLFPSRSPMPVSPR